MKFDSFAGEVWTVTTKETEGTETLTWEKQKAPDQEPRVKGVIHCSRPIHGRSEILKPTNTEQTERGGSYYMSAFRKTGLFYTPRLCSLQYLLFKQA